MRLQHNVDAVVVLETAILFGLVGAWDFLKGYRAFDGDLCLATIAATSARSCLLSKATRGVFLWELHSVYNSGWVQDPKSFETKVGADLCCVAICPMFGVQGRRQILIE
jgi:hypothetical protein